MVVNTETLLKAKVYGSPYMPKNIPELIYFIRIYFNWSKEWLLNSHNYPYNVFSLISSIIVASWILNKFLVALKYLWGYGIVYCINSIYSCVAKLVFSVVFSLPSIKKKVDSEVAVTVKSIEESIMKNSPELMQFPEIPKDGVSKEQILQELNNLHELKHSDWANGRVSGAVYHGGDELGDLQVAAYHKNYLANQLHPDVFPGIRKMEAEIVSMVLKLFNGPEGSCGSSTSGGTESLLLAGLAAREYGRRYKGISKPEIIAPITIHAGIEKACYYFGMTLHKVRLDPKTYKVDLSQVKRLINSNTVLLCGSAPNFPHGIIDDIEGLSKLATKYNIPLHVDACLGSFIVTFLEKSKVHGDMKLPLFDFRLPGVTSISCDTHKYGFAPKGSSIIMYRNSKLRECQYYVSSDWTGGMYGSPTLAGSRPGALMAGCWATLVNIGEEGYKKSCFEIVSASMKLKKAIQTSKILSDNLEIIGDPIGSVIAFKSKNDDIVDIYLLGDLLTKKGWHFSTLQKPAALHFALTKLTVPIIEELITDLENTILEIMEIIRNTPSGSKTRKTDTGALYGVAGSISTRGVADRLIVSFLDTLYKV